MKKHNYKAFVLVVGLFISIGCMATFNPKSLDSGKKVPKKVSCDEIYRGEIQSDQEMPSGEFRQVGQAVPFSEWSTEDQFDQLLVKKQPALLKAMDVKVRVRTWKKKQNKMVLKLDKKYPVKDWDTDFDYYRVDGFLPRVSLNIDEIPAEANKFEISVYVKDKQHCKKTYKVITNIK